jgi:hypothetical protein
MRRGLVVVALGGVAAALACHSAIIRVERKGSIGLIHTPAPEPKINAYDGHVVPLPEQAAVNCYDVIRTRTGDTKGEVYSGDWQTCSSDDFITDFWGYWTPWTDERSRRSDVACGREEVCGSRRRDVCRTAVSSSFAPSWYARSAENQRVQAAWILDEYLGWSTEVEESKFNVTSVEPRVLVEEFQLDEDNNEDTAAVADKDRDECSDTSIVNETNKATKLHSFGAANDNDKKLPQRTVTRIEFERDVTPSRCLLVRKVIDRDSKLFRNCGSYGYPVMPTETDALQDEAKRKNVVAISPIQVLRIQAECTQEQRAQLAIAPGDAVIVEPCPEPQTVMSFIHLSDAQIREPNAKLVNRAASKYLDQFIGTFEHDYEQELFSPFFYEAIIETVNKEVAAARAIQKRIDLDFKDPKTGALSPRRGDLYRAPPSFMIHTGDAMDSGLASEFRYFLETSNRLHIPWYQVVGNHDMLAFGNLSLGNWEADDEDYVCTGIGKLLNEFKLNDPINNDNESYRDDDRSCAEKVLHGLAPDVFRKLCLRLDIVGDDFQSRPQLDGESSTDAFMRAHCRLTRFEGCKRHALPVNAPTYWRSMHGFQSFALKPGTIDTHHEGPRPNPYYAFVSDVVDTAGSAGFGVNIDAQHKEPTRRVWTVVLNTVSEDGDFGAMDERQLRWLEQLLPNAGNTSAVRAGDVVLLFAHHPIWAIDDDATRRRLEKIIANAPGVLAYFTGHTHYPDLRAVPYSKAKHHKVACDGKNPCGFWEVVAPSMIEFPQMGRQVTFKMLSNSTIGYFDVLGFSPQIADGQNDVDRAMRGAERDLCVQHPDRCEAGRPRGAKQEHLFSRLFVRLPVNHARTANQSKAVCRPQHARMPDDVPTCADPCTQKGRGTCRTPKPSTYFVNEREPERTPR